MTVAAEEPVELVRLRCTLCNGKRGETSHFVDYDEWYACAQCQGQGFVYAVADPDKGRDIAGYFTVEEPQRFVFRCVSCDVEWSELERQVQPDGHFACALCDEGELLIFPNPADTWQAHVAQNGMG